MFIYLILIMISVKKCLMKYNAKLCLRMGMKK